MTNKTTKSQQQTGIPTVNWQFEIFRFNFCGYLLPYSTSNTDFIQFNSKLHFVFKANFLKPENVENKFGINWDENMSNTEYLKQNQQ